MAAIRVLCDFVVEGGDLRAATLKASDLRPNRSLVVLTGANLALGTTTAPASSKHSMAEPMAVSNWKTAGVPESLGFTVFLFLMSGRCSTPPEAPRVACCRAHRLRRSKVYVVPSLTFCPQDDQVGNVWQNTESFFWIVSQTSDSSISEVAKQGCTVSGNQNSVKECVSPPFSMQHMSNFKRRTCL